MLVSISSTPIAFCNIIIGSLLGFAMSNPCAIPVKGVVLQYPQRGDV